MTLTKKERRKVFQAVNGAWVDCWDYMDAIKNRFLQRVAMDVLNVAEQEPWRELDSILTEVLDY